MSAKGAQSVVGPENFRHLSSHTHLVHHTQASKKDEKLVNINGLIESAYQTKNKKEAEQKQNEDSARTPQSRSRVDKPNSRQFQDDSIHNKSDSGQDLLSNEAALSIERIKLDLNRDMLALSQMDVVSDLRARQSLNDAKKAPWTQQNNKQGREDQMEDSTGLIKLNNEAGKDPSPEDEINIESLLENVMSQMLDETTNTQVNNEAPRECNYMFDTNIFQDDSEFVRVFSSIYNIKADIECTVDDIAHAANGN